MNPTLPKPTVTVIGAASTTFGPKVLRDILNFPEVGGCTFNFVDTNTERLETYDKLARRVNALLKTLVTVRSSPRRRDLLAGSDYVILSVDTGHYDTWERDFTVPNAHGYKQVLGELGGPGGLFHALRQIPLHLEIARDIEDLCPKAVVMVASNPLNRICLALERHAKLHQVVGLCHGVEMALYLLLNRVLGINGDDLQALAAGTNHLTWLLELRRASTGEDLYPFMREKLRALPPGEEGLSRKLLNVYGYFPATLDSHAGEYIPFAAEFAGTSGIDFDEHRKQEGQRWDYLKRLAESEAEWDKYEMHYGSQEGLSEELRLDDFFKPRNWADTLAFPILAARISNKRAWLPAVNLINGGAVSHLPADVFAEAPAVVDSTGIYLQQVALPKTLAAFNRRDVDQMELTVEAAVTGERNDILKAMLLDPTVESVRAAENTLDAMLKAHEQHLPQMV